MIAFVAIRTRTHLQPHHYNHTPRIRVDLDAEFELAVGRRSRLRQREDALGIAAQPRGEARLASERQPIAKGGDRDGDLAAAAATIEPPCDPESIDRTPRGIVEKLTRDATLRLLLDALRRALRRPLAAPWRRPLPSRAIKSAYAPAVLTAVAPRTLRGRRRLERRAARDLHARHTRADLAKLLEARSAAKRQQTQTGASARVRVEF